MFKTLQARKAMVMHQKGQTKEAMAEYGKLYASGYISATYMLPYCILLLREGDLDDCQKVKEILKKAEKAPDMKKEKRPELHVYYACAQYRLGHLTEAINLLEASHQKMHTGLVYETLGYLYIEAGDAEKALAYNQEALDYDDEDSVTLDNIGQVYYRLLGDKDKAKEYFEKALEIKDSQIDTLYFLAQYDIADGKNEAAKEKLETAMKGNFSPLNYATRERVTEALKALE